jgi:hypothetical protein
MLQSVANMTAATAEVCARQVDLLPLAPATPEHLATYAAMDISLDPFPYAGTTTTCESLYMGEQALLVYVRAALQPSRRVVRHEGAAMCAHASRPT